MAEESTPDTSSQPDAAATEAAETPELGDAGKKALDRMKAERDEARRTAKARERELEQFRTASMSEAERAVVEAEQRGRLAVLTDMGKRLARTQFEAAAARRNASYDATSALEYVDLSRFVGEDGEPDSKAITAAVERLVPSAEQTPAPVPSFDGGTRSGGALPLNGDPLLNALKSKLGIPS